jgi:hypothetical protein
MQTIITVSDTQKESYTDHYHINIMCIYIDHINIMYTNTYIISTF